MTSEPAHGLLQIVYYLFLFHKLSLNIRQLLFRGTCLLLSRLRPTPQLHRTLTIVILRWYNYQRIEVYQSIAIESYYINKYLIWHATVKTHSRLSLRLGGDTRIQFSLAQSDIINKNVLIKLQYILRESRKTTHKKTTVDTLTNIPSFFFWLNLNLLIRLRGYQKPFHLFIVI